MKIRDYILAIQFVIIVVLSIFLFNKKEEKIKVKDLTYKIYSYKGDSFGIFKVFIQPLSNLVFIKTKIQGKEAIFLLDTGASSTFIDVNQIEKYDLIAQEIPGALVNGIGGVTSYYQIVNTSLIEIDSKKYYVNFNASDLGNVVKTFKDEYGFTCLGILGSDFFEKYGAVIDYEKNIMFTQK